MDTHQINFCFKQERKFIGAFARDCLPENINEFPCGLIINTDSSFEKGEHWIAIFLKSKEKGEYFDSFGLPPLHSDFINFLNLHCQKGWSYNTCTIQHYKSKSCGLFCIDFLKSRFKDVSYTSFISKFSVNLSKNEFILKNGNNL